MSAETQALRNFTHTIVTVDGRKHRVGVDGLDQHGGRPERAVSIRPIKQIDGTWPSLTKRDAA